MPADERRDPWVTLGSLLLARRAQIDPRYTNRRLFCEETGLDYRVVYDIEKNKRQNYGPAVLAAIERGYRWAPGSIEAVLAGGAPTERVDATIRPAPVSVSVGIPSASVVTSSSAARAEPDDEVEREAIGRLETIMQLLRADAAARREQEQRIAQLERQLSETRDELQELRERKAQERDGERDKNSKGA